MIRFIDAYNDRYPRDMAAPPLEYADHIASSTPAVAALKQATRGIPIIFCVVSDPAGQGFVASLARPGGNITGFSFVDFPMLGKWVEMLKEIAPSVKRIRLVFNPQTAPYYPVFLRDFGRTASAPGGELSATPVRDEAQIEAAVSAFAREPGGGLIAAPDPFINTRHALVIALAERHRLPVIYGVGYFAKEGGGGSSHTDRTRSTSSAARLRMSIAS
jgi:putative ABC transport system substrate-binding protein